LIDADLDDVADTHGCGWASGLVVDRDMATLASCGAQGAGLEQPDATQPLIYSGFIHHRLQCRSPQACDGG
jgi:hypothetical protein